MKRTIHFTIGAPGSGKSTFANELIRARDDVATVHLDGIRCALFGSKRAFWDNPTPERREYVRLTYQRAFEALMEDRAGSWDIVLPNTNTDVWFYEHALDMSKAYGYQLQIKLFDVPINVLLRRNAARPFEDQLKVPTVVEYWERLQREDRYWKDLV